MPRDKWRKRKKGTMKQREQTFKVAGSKMKGAKKTMFFKPKHKAFADIVKIDTPKNARESVGDLLSMYPYGNKKLIKQVTNLASNRAGVISKNERVSPEQRREAREVQGIYRKAFERMQKSEQPKVERFISTHPERYGYDNEKYFAVVVVEENGKVKEAHPANDLKVAERILKQLK